jgi:hypothetical protein
VKSKERPDGRVDWMGRPKPRRGRPVGSGMTLLMRVERMIAGEQASLALNRVEAASLLPLLRHSEKLRLFLMALQSYKDGTLEREPFEFMLDELHRAFQGFQGWQQPIK